MTDATDPKAPDPIAMTERAIRLLEEDERRSQAALTALALMEQVRDYLRRQQKGDA